MPWRLNQASGFRQQGKYNRTSAAERSEIRREAVHPPPVQDAPPCPDLAHPEFYSKSSLFFPPLSNHPMKNAQVIPGEPNLDSSFVAGASTSWQYLDGAARSLSYRLVALPMPHGATATEIVAYDFVVAATVTDGGVGYVSAPNVVMGGGGASGAQAAATVSNGTVT